MSQKQDIMDFFIQKKKNPFYFYCTLDLISARLESIHGARRELSTNLWCTMRVPLHFISTVKFNYNEIIEIERLQHKTLLQELVIERNCFNEPSKIDIDAAKQASFVVNRETVMRFMAQK